MYKPNTKILGTLNNNKIEKSNTSSTSSVKIITSPKCKIISVIDVSSSDCSSNYGSSKSIQKGLNNINRSKNCVRIFNGVHYTHSQHVSKFASTLNTSRLTKKYFWVFPCRSLFHSFFGVFRFCVLYPLKMSHFDCLKKLKQWVFYIL